MSAFHTTGQLPSGGQVRVADATANIDYWYGPYSAEAVVYYTAEELSQMTEEQIAALTKEGENYVKTAAVTAKQVACREVSSAIRYKGKTVALVETDGSVKEYWWKSGITDDDLVGKGGGELPTNVVLQTTATPTASAPEDNVSLSAVRYTEQFKSSEDKAQARANIDAASTTEVSAKHDILDTVGNSTTIAAGGVSNLGTISGEQSLTLVLPTGTGKGAEYHLFFTAGEDAISFTINDGVVVHWNSELSTTQGNIYEVSFYYINNILFGLSAEFEITED